MKTQTTLTYRRPTLFTDFDQLVVGESTRRGGVSPVPFASLNLGLFTDDSSDNVAENRRRFCAELGILPEQLAGSYQVHGDQVLVVEKAGQYEGYDALISRKKNVFLTVTVADCVPVLIFDPVGEAVAAIHAGWKGTLAGIVAKTLAEMNTALGTHARNCHAYIGTCIDECSFEVDGDVADHFATPFKRWEANKNKFFIDLKKANQQQLIQSGLPANQIEISPYSTYLQNDDYFSYRKENGQTGRLLGLIGITHPT